MKRLATFAAALAVAVASPCAAAELAPDESSEAVMAASAAVADAMNAATPVLENKDLKPGQYWWSKMAPENGDVQVVISLADQLAFVYRGEALIGVSTISSGKPGKDTPPGIFPILEREVPDARPHDHDLVRRDNPRRDEVITHLLARREHEVRCGGHKPFRH